MVVRTHDYKNTRKETLFGGTLTSCCNKLVFMIHEYSEFMHTYMYV